MSTSGAFDIIADMPANSNVILHFKSAFGKPFSDETAGQAESYSAVFDGTQIGTSPMQRRANRKLASSCRNDHNG